MMYEYVFGKEEYTNAVNRRTQVTFTVPYDASMCKDELLQTIKPKSAEKSISL